MVERACGTTHGEAGAMKVSDLKTTEELHAGALDDPEYRAEWERTHLAHEVAQRVIAYRVEHQLTRMELARMLVRFYP